MMESGIVYREEHRERIAMLGFPAPKDVSERYGIGRIFPHKTRRTGLYLLVLADGYFYIGQAKDVVRRFAEHRRRYGSRLVGFSFIRSPQRGLTDRESQLIRTGEKLGLPLEQTAWKSQVYGSTDFDALLEDGEYESWLSDPAAHFAKASWPQPSIEPGRTSRDQKRYGQLLKHSSASELIDALRLFVSLCIPSARKTAPDYWNIACLPSTNRSTYPRLVCISVHVMEVLVIGHARHEPEDLWGFIVVARTPIEARFGSLPSAESSLKLGIDEERLYKSAGADQCRICFNDLAEFLRLLESDVILQAARLLLYNAMRKGVNRYAKYHCTALTNAILDGR